MGFFFPFLPVFVRANSRQPMAPGGDAVKARNSWPASINWKRST